MKVRQTRVKVRQESEGETGEVCQLRRDLVGV